MIQPFAAETAPEIGVAPHLAEGFHTVFSGVAAGNADPRFGDANEVLEAREALLAGLPPLDRVYVIQALNGTDFVDVDRSDDTRISVSPEFAEVEVAADAMITSQPGTGLMLNAADCIPLALYESDRRLLALAHLGWRGAVGNLHHKVLDYMKDEYKLNPKHTVAYMGPSIRPYEAQTLNETWENDPEWQEHITERDDYFLVDIPGFVKGSLIRYGLNPDGSIAMSPIDTGRPNPQMEHFSFTRHKNEGTRNGRNSFVTAMV